MEKTIAVLCEDGNLSILGKINLPNLTDTRVYHIYLNDRYMMISVIHHNKIFTDSDELNFCICIKKDLPNHPKSHIGAFTSSFNSPHTLTREMTSEEIINHFYLHLHANKINFKSYFRKNKIEKILKSDEINLEI